MNLTLNLGGQLLTLYPPKIMGILNLTADSFYDGGRYLSEESVLRRAHQIITEGAEIIDLGAASSRPGAELIPAKAELEKLLPAIAAIQSEFPKAYISIDTYNAETARKTIEAGAHIINDISGGTLDPAMLETAAGLQVPYILMHIRGKPKDMLEHISETSIFDDVCYYFSEKLDILYKYGANDIILDPGFGFAKSTVQNYQLLSRLSELQHIFGKAVLAGVSRKSMINKVIGTKPDAALNGTTVLNTLALQQNVHLLRVHDVKEAQQAITLVNYYKKPV